MKKMLRYEVPVDDQVHEIVLRGYPVLVAAARVDLVEFWAEDTDSWSEETYLLKVFGTGQEIPDRSDYLGTTQRISGLVWHLYDLST